MRMLLRLIRSTLSLVPVIALFAPAASVARQGQRDAAVSVIELEPYLGALWSFRARLGGREGRFLLDTGGGITILTPQAAKIAGCRPWGRLTGFRMRGGRLDLPRCDEVSLGTTHLRLRAPVAGIWDLMGQFPSGAPSLMGSVALDAFAGRLVTLDLAHHRLIVASTHSLDRRTRQEREVSVHYSRELEGFALTALVGVKARSGDVWMELDSGSDGGAVVARHIASELGLNPSVKGGQELSASIEGGVGLKAQARVDDLIYDGNIGLPTISRWVVTFDLKAGRLWIGNASTPPCSPTATSSSDVFRHAASRSASCFAVTPRDSHRTKI